MERPRFYFFAFLALCGCWLSSCQFLDRSNVPVLFVPSDDTSIVRRCSLESGRTCKKGPNDDCCFFTDREGLNFTEQRHFATLSFRRPGSILVGAMDAAYALDYALQTQGKINLTSSERDRCISTLTQFTSLTNVEEYRCHNHIRHFDILPGRDPETLFICGTNAFFGSCSYVETSSLSAAVISLGTGESSLALGIVPTDPALFYTGMMRYYNSSDPVLINGLTITTTANHGNIGFRTLSIDTSNNSVVSTMLRTDVTEASFVARPQIIVDIFFHDYTEGTEMSGAQDLVFVAFQEANGQTWQSRIARICKNDIGSTMNGGRVAGETMDYKFPVTFVKASISCRVLKKNTLQLDYHYNRIFDFELVTNGSYGPGESEAMIGYGLFADTGLQPSGSAVCVYSASRSSGSVVNNGLYDIFTRQFVGEVDNNGLTCADKGASRQSSGHTNREIEADMSQIGSPLFVLEGVSLVKLQVDPRQPVIRNGTLGYQDVMFAASNEGKIYKIFIADESLGNRPIISEIIQLNDNSQVYQMALQETPEGKHLYVTTNTTVYRLPLQNCKENTTKCCSDCLSSRDPYCGFDRSSLSCVVMTTDTNASNVLQHLDNDGVGEVCEEYDRACVSEPTPSTSIAPSVGGPSSTISSSPDDTTTLQQTSTTPLETSTPFIAVDSSTAALQTTSTSQLDTAEQSTTTSLAVVPALTQSSSVSSSKGRIIVNCDDSDVVCQFGPTSNPTDAVLSTTASGSYIIPVSVLVAIFLTLSAVVLVVLVVMGALYLKVSRDRYNVKSNNSTSHYQNTMVTGDSIQNEKIGTMF